MIRVMYDKVKQKNFITNIKSIFAFKSTRVEWKNILREFIGQQQQNEKIVVTKNKDEFEADLSGIFKKIKFFVTLYDGAYRLIIP